MARSFLPDVFREWANAAQELAVILRTSAVRDREVLEHIIRPVLGRVLEAQRAQARSKPPDLFDTAHELVAEIYEFLDLAQDAAQIGKEAAAILFRPVHEALIAAQLFLEDETRFRDR